MFTSIIFTLALLASWWAICAIIIQVANAFIWNNNLDKASKEDKPAFRTEIMARRNKIHKNGIILDIISVILWGIFYYIK